MANKDNNNDVIVDTVDVLEGLMPDEEFEKFKENVVNSNRRFEQLKLENPNLSSKEIFDIMNNKNKNSDYTDNLISKENLNKFRDYLEKQWQDEKMEYASDHKAGETSRREKLREWMDEMGLPQDPSEMGLNTENGLPEVEEDKKLPWNVNDAGIVDRS